MNMEIHLFGLYFAYINFPASIRRLEKIMEFSTAKVFCNKEVFMRFLLRRVGAGDGLIYLYIHIFECYCLLYKNLFLENMMQIVESGRMPVFRVDDDVQL